MNDIRSRLEHWVSFFDGEDYEGLDIVADLLEAADAIETGRQWETIARRLALHLRPGAHECIGCRDALAAFRDLADRTPTPTDGG